MIDAGAASLTNGVLVIESGAVEIADLGIQGGLGGWVVVNGFTFGQSASFSMNRTRIEAVEAFAILNGTESQMTIYESVIAQIQTDTQHPYSAIANTGDMKIIGSRISAFNGGVTVFNDFGSHLIVSTSVIHDNTTDRATLVNDGTASVENSAIVRNISTATFSGAGGVDNSGDINVVNTTVSNNRGSIDAVINNGLADFINVTISENISSGQQRVAAVWQGGGVPDQFPADSHGISFSNSIVDGICLVRAGQIVSKGGNLLSPQPEPILAGDARCILNHPTDQLDVLDFGLGPLADNGGSTLTHALIQGSPAIGAAIRSNCRDTDQRGFARPADACDSGAYDTGGGEPLVGQIGSIFPDRGGDTGSVTTTVRGVGLQQGAGIRLSRAGQPDIIGSTAQVNEIGSLLTTTFDLVGAARGAWDVVVTNPDGATFTLPGGFTVEEGRAARVWADIVGNPRFRPQRPQRFHITYGNSGNVDSPGGYIWLTGLPTTGLLRAAFGFDVRPHPVPAAMHDPLIDPFVFSLGGDRTLFVQVHRIPAGFAGVLQLELTTAESRPFTLRSFVVFE